MFEGLECVDWDSPDFDVEVIVARDPLARQYFEDQLDDPFFTDPNWPPVPPDLLPDPPERPFLDSDLPLYERDLETFSDAEAVTRLIEVEAGIAAAQALRARLVALLAQNRPATADRPMGQPGAATRPDPADVVPEVLDVSEWLPHELQMAHPYSQTAVADLVETSLVLTGRLSATLDLLASGRIDYPRARILADLLGTCSIEVAHTVESLVLIKAPNLTPGGLASAIRRVLARIDAAALRRRHTKARRAADVGYYPTQDGMSRLYADLPLPVAAACSDAISSYAQIQRAEGDRRPIGQVRAEILSDLILRPWDTSRPSVSGQVTIHLTIPTASAAGGLDERAAEAEVNGQTITAAQCRAVLAQLHTSRLFLALHAAGSGLQAVASPAQVGRAAQGRGLRPPPATSRYRPTPEQDRHVRTRDRTCRHFGCNRKAMHCDIDHHERHPDGATTVCNLCCYCRTHHRLKHQAPG